jgi:hypothetical protein
MNSHNGSRSATTLRQWGSARLVTHLFAGYSRASCPRAKLTPSEFGGTMALASTSLGEASARIQATDLERRKTGAATGSSAGSASSRVHRAGTPVCPGREEVRRSESKRQSVFETQDHFVRIRPRQHLFYLKRLAPLRLTHVDLNGPRVLLTCCSTVAAGSACFPQGEPR